MCYSGCNALKPFDFAQGMALPRIFGNLRSESFPLQLVLDSIRFRNSLEYFRSSGFRLGSFAWERSLGIFRLSRLGTLAWDLRLGELGL